MIVCPLCEHQQAGGLECEVCGRALADATGAPAEPPPLVGLEPTLLASAAAPAADAFPDLEPTGHAAVEAAPAPPLLIELEPTLAPPVDAPEGEAVPALERGGEAIPDEERTPFPAVVRCRYCGTEGGFGERLCARCGMRLPVPAAFPAALHDDAVLCGCGMLVQGSRCPACGARRGA